MNHSPEVLLPQKADIRRVLIVKWSALGDLLISTILCDDLYRAFPKATLELNTLPLWTSLFSEDKRFDNIIAVDVCRRNAWLARWRWLTQLNRGKYDLLVDLQGNDRSRFLISLLCLFRDAPRYRMGLHRGFPYNIAPDSTFVGKHSIDLQRAALHAGGILAEACRPSLYLSSEDCSRADVLLTKNHLLKGEYALLMPGSQAAGKLKRWGAKRYAALAILLHETLKCEVVLAGGPVEADVCQEITSICKGTWLVDLCGKTLVKDLIPLAAGARLVVSNDTGTAHVAACAESPILVICGPTDPARVKPVGPNVQTIQSEIDCVNCYRKECSYHDCMESLSVKMVFDKATAMITE